MAHVNTFESLTDLLKRNPTTPLCLAHPRYTGENKPRLRKNKTERCHGCMEVWRCRHGNSLVTRI